MTDTQKRWWGDYPLTEGCWAHFAIGPLSLYARRVSGEWRFAWLNDGDPLSEQININLQTDGDPDFDGRNLGRFAISNTGDALRIEPRLADRTFVVRPEIPLYVLAHEQSTLYVSTPLWIALFATSNPVTLLTEIPTFRSSDTWFGENTRDGEHCYASKTNARTGISQLANVAHRAITPIVISNEGTDNLKIEQLRVPVTNLALYEATDGRLWTDRVRFERKTGESSAALRIGSNHESVQEGRIKIADARTPHDTNPMVRAFSHFFS